MSRVITDFDLAVMTIYGEARGEPFEGKVAVGEVIRNRMLQRYSSDGTVAGTVLRPYQFSIWNTGGVWSMAHLEYESEIYEECVTAWHASEYSDFTLGANLYFNPKLAFPKWRNTTPLIVTIGNHQFHKDG